MIAYSASRVQKRLDAIGTSVNGHPCVKMLMLCF